MLSKNHHFLMLDTSTWPFNLSLMLFNSFFSFCLFIKFKIFSNFLLSIFILIIMSMIWWFTYSSELNIFGFMSNNLEQSLKFSMLLFISSELFFFFSFFWSNFHFFLSPELEVSFLWPFFSLKSFDPFGVPLLNTLILLCSGFTITMSHFYICKTNDTKALIYSVLTVILGLIFTMLQWKEYKNSFFSISDGSFGSVFFMLTGFHGMHVIIGTIFIMINVMYFKKFSFYGYTMVSFEMASWYWHFVDVVWIFLYFTLYYMNL